MSPQTLPGQIVLHLTWPNVGYILQILQTTLASSGRLRALLVAGENLQLCQELQQLWLSAAQNRQNDLCAQRVAAGREKVCLPEELAPLQGVSKRNVAAKLKLIELQGVQASVLALSSGLNVWVRIEPSQTPCNLIPSWEVSFVFDPEVIAQLLRTPLVAEAAPHCCNLEAADLTSERSEILRRFWLQLLSAWESDAFKEIGRNPQLERQPLLFPFRLKRELTQASILNSFREQTPIIYSPEWKSEVALSSSIFWEAPFGILYESLDGGILNSNPAFCQMIGYTEAQLRHLDRRSISHPEDFAAEVRLIQQMLQYGLKRQTLRKRYLRRDGSFVTASVVMSLIGDGDEDSYLLSFVTDISAQTQTEQEICQRLQREKLLSEISAKIRTTFDLSTIIETAVQRLREVLDADRVLAYQLHEDGRGVCIAESVNSSYPAMKGRSFPTNSIPLQYLQAYSKGSLWSVDDVRTTTLSECHRQMLEELHVRSMIAVGIQRFEEGTQPLIGKLWGLLMIHHCRAPRCWTLDEKQLVQAVGEQMTIAIEQATLLYRLQAQVRELEAQVNQYRESIERSLHFEKLIRNLTATLRQTLDEHQILKAAVEGLAETLGVDACYASLFAPEKQVLQVQCEHFSNRLHLGESLVGKLFYLQDWHEECRQKFLTGEICILDIPEQATAEDDTASLYSLLSYAFKQKSPSENEAPSVASSSQLVAPIFDDRKPLGMLCIFYQTNRKFEQAEINLVEQVTAQCALAIRQARLWRQRQAERSSAEYFRLFLEKSTDVFVEYDSLLRYIYVNPAGAALLGKPATEIIGKTDREILDENSLSRADTIETLLRQVFNTGEKVVVNYEVCVGGEVRTFETVYAPIADETGTIHRVIGIGRDVTESRRQWQLLQEQNQQLTAINRLKEEFIATTSHELRTPLTAILGFSSVLLEESFGPLNAKQKLYVDRIHSSGQHLLELINDILDLSRIEADRLELEPQLVFIQDICESVVSLVQERVNNQGLTLEVEVEPDLEYMFVDPRRLKQMLLNLLSNAVKFTPEGKIGLKVSRSCKSAASAESESASSSEMIYFTVWDTGIGIDQEDQLRIFSPFSQIDSSLARKYQGTGLGLAIVRKLAELHGGSVFVESSKGRGSRFTIALPLQPFSSKPANFGQIW
ncbi:MAG: ATP-binding protein [Oscillatoriaceae bacterium SKYG93]|nr:ATP-binding protein [Oscillatoriaceae bacterium SKYG93]MDW8454696.1 ATP-binding protein [Oscillatoriaceae cyanobacterium SKYGB_i_bin93]